MKWPEPENRQDGVKVGNFLIKGTTITVRSADDSSNRSDNDVDTCTRKIVFEENEDTIEDESKSCEAIVNIQSAAFMGIRRNPSAKDREQTAKCVGNFHFRTLSSKCADSRILLAKCVNTSNNITQSARGIDNTMRPHSTKSTYRIQASNITCNTNRSTEPAKRDDDNTDTVRSESVKNNNTNKMETHPAKCANRTELAKCNMIRITQSSKCVDRRKLYDDSLLINSMKCLDNRSIEILKYGDIWKQCPVKCDDNKTQSAILFNCMKLCSSKHGNTSKLQSIKHSEIRTESAKWINTYIRGDNERTNKTQSDTTDDNTTRGTETTKGTAAWTTIAPKSSEKMKPAKYDYLSNIENIKAADSSKDNIKEITDFNRTATYTDDQCVLKLTSDKHRADIVTNSSFVKHSKNTLLPVFARNRGILGYNTDDLLNDNYPADGAASPRQDGPDTPAQYGREKPDWRYTPVPDRYTPANGYMTPPPSRPKSGSIRPLGRPASRNDAGIQQADTQRSYTMQDPMMRPTSPVQRILDRSNTQPFMSMQGPMPGSQMDPITRQYYRRKWSSRAPSSTDITLNRYGRAGGVWRHVRACVANTGAQIAFIDGIVKEEDNVFFPQFPNTSPYQNAPSYITARLPARKQQIPAKTTTYNTASNRRAKEGFQYWFKEPKPVDLKTSLRLKARMVGQGY